MMKNQLILIAVRRRSWRAQADLTNENVLTALHEKEAKQ
jgi:hypothetical protein